MGTKQRDSEHALLTDLTRELFQTEMSASRHCRREAARQPYSPPAGALVTVAVHADHALEEIRELARAEELSISGFGMALEEAFSEVREHVADHLFDGERCYRSILLDLRHGVDVVRMMSHVAQRAERTAVTAWCDAWLAKRMPLLGDVEERLAWFAHHPKIARHSAGAMALFSRRAAA